MSFLQASKDLSGHLADEGAATAARGAFANAITRSGFSDSIKGGLHEIESKLALVDGEAVIGQLKFAEINRLIRQGNLRTLFRNVLGREIISETEENAARLLEDIKQAPEGNIRAVEEISEQIKQEVPGSNVRGTSAAEIRAKMSPGAFEQVAAIYEKIKAHFGTGVKVVTAIGAIVVVAEFAEAVSKYIDEHEGVILTKKLSNGDFEVTKFGSRSCLHPGPTDPTNLKSYHLNLYFYLRKVIATSDNVETTKINAAIAPTMLNMTTLPTILSNAALVTKLIPIYESSLTGGFEEFTTPCTSISDSTTPCVAWNTVANVNQMEYLNPTNLADNEAVTCTKNVTVATAIGALLEKGAIALGDAASKALGFNIKWIVFAIIGIVIAYFMFGFIKK